MEYLGTVFSTVSVGKNNTILIVMQIIIFLIIVFAIIKILRLYFKNIELKKEPEKNQAEIEKNFENIEKIKKIFTKVGGIAFAVIIITMVILVNL